MRRQTGGVNGLVGEIVIGGSDVVAGAGTGNATTGIGIIGGGSRGSGGGVSGNAVSSGGGSSVSTYQNANVAQTAPAWAFQLLPSLYNHYQKVLRNRIQPRPKLEQTACRYTLIRTLPGLAVSFSLRLFHHAVLYTGTRVVPCYLLSLPCPANFIPNPLQNLCTASTGSHRSS